MEILRFKVTNITCKHKNIVKASHMKIIFLNLNIVQYFFKIASICELSNLFILLPIQGNFRNLFFSYKVDHREDWQEIEY